MLVILTNYLFLTFLTTLAISNNLVLFFISWVGLNVSLYGILLKGFNSYNVEMTLKYFLSGAIITTFLLVGIVFFYLEFFSFNISIASYIYFNNDSLLPIFSGNVLNNNTTTLVEISTIQRSFFLIFISTFLFKLGAFPFHFYISDMYQALDYKKTMFIFTVPLKLIVFLTLLKFLENFWYMSNCAFDVLVCAGIGSIYSSTFTAIRQVKLKKFWAYSYLNSVGFSLVATAVGIGSNFGEISLYTAKYYFITYLITWCGILDLFVNTKVSFRKKSEEILYITDLLAAFGNTSLNLRKNISYANCIGKFQISFLAFTASLMGLPPTLGFFAKMYVYLDLIESKNSIVYLIFILCVTPIMSYAYLRVLLYVISPISEFFKINTNLKSIYDGGDNPIFSSKKAKLLFKRNFSQKSIFDLSANEYATFLVLFPIMSILHLNYSITI